MQTTRFLLAYLMVFGIAILPVKAANHEVPLLRT